MFADFIAGWIAGGASLVVGHPLDTVKARLQTTNVYSGISDCVIKTVRQEAVGGLYKGMLIPFLSSGMLHSLLFAGYGVTLKLMHPEDRSVENRKDLPMREIIIATLVGAVTQLVPSIPIEHVKTKLQVQRVYMNTRWGGSHHRAYAFREQQPVCRSPFHCMNAIYRRHGIRGLYKGGSAMFVRDCIGLIFYIPVYELLYRYLRSRNCSEIPSQVFAGGTAGSVCWLSICPFEVIKNRIQTQPELAHGKVMRTAAYIRQRDGVRAFYKGGLTLVLRGFPVNAVLFVVYSKALALAEKLEAPSSSRAVTSDQNNSLYA